MTSGVFIYLSLPCLLRQGLSLNLELSVLVRLAGKGGPRDLPVSLASSPALRLQVCATVPDCCMSTGDLNPGPCTCAASTLPAEPFIQSPVSVFPMCGLCWSWGRGVSGHLKTSPSFWSLQIFLWTPAECCSLGALDSAAHTQILRDYQSQRILQSDLCL